MPMQHTRPPAAGRTMQVVAVAPAAFALALCAIVALPARGQTLTTVYSFQNGVDGGFPSGGVTLDAAGNLDVTTSYGGSDFTLGGTVDRLSPPRAPGGAWTKTLLYSFAAATGAQPSAGVVVGAGGKLFGTIQNVEGHPAGGIYQIAPPASPDGAWTYRLLWTGIGVTNAPLTRDGSGALIVPTTGGGSSGNGSIVRYVPPGDAKPALKQVLHDFAGGPDGGFPQGRLAVDRDGNVYGTTSLGGQGSGGVVFRLAPPAAEGGAWTYQVIHTFGGNDGWQPYAGLALDAAGRLYGTTTFGGGHDLGVVFRLNPPLRTGAPWTETVLHAFDGSDGGYPDGELAFDAAGELYGTTSDANLGSGYGSIFKLARAGAGAWSFATVYRFQGNDGERPVGPLTAATDGALYGTTYFGGSTGSGVVYRFAP